MRKNLLDKKGCQFSATIRDMGKTYHVDGKIQVEGGRVFLCQDYVDGACCDDLFSYDYSWCVEKGTANDLEKNYVTDLKVFDGNLLKITYKWAVLCDGSDDFKNTLEAYCIAFHPECRLDFDYEDTYYGWNGAIVDYDIEPIYVGATIFTLKEFKQAINYKLETKSNEKSNSVKVQRKTPDVTNGERFTGISVSGRTGKIAVSIGHLSYKTVSNECF